MEKLLKDWPLFMLIGGLIVFFTIIIIDSKKQNKNKIAGEGEEACPKIKPAARSSKSKS